MNEAQRMAEVEKFKNYFSYISRPGADKLLAWLAVYVQITPQVSGTATVQRVQLYNKNNKLWADKAVNIPLKNVQEGVLYRFTFDFTEKEV